MINLDIKFVPPVSASDRTLLRSSHFRYSAHQMSQAFVVKRDGSTQPFAFEKITDRLRKLAEEHAIACDVQLVVQKVVGKMVSGISTTELDKIAVKAADELGPDDKEFYRLSSTLNVDNMHKQTPATFSAAMIEIHEKGRMLSTFMDVARAFGDRLDEIFKLRVGGSLGFVEMAAASEAELETMFKLDDTRHEPMPFCKTANVHALEVATAFGVTVPTLREILEKHGDELDEMFAKREVASLSDDFMQVVFKHGSKLDAMIDHKADFQYDNKALSTMARGYLLRNRERPQYMLMRIAVCLFLDDLVMVERIYKEMSERRYIHASPTCFHAGMAKNANLSPCFLLTMHHDSIEGIMKTLHDSARISKGGGGIGISVTKVRASGSHIASTLGVSNGIVPMIKMYEGMLKYVDQGGGKRKGSAAFYLEPWHADVEAFIALKFHDGMEDQRARDIFTALWIPDIFMRRVLQGQMWTLFCPTKVPKLLDTWGEEFDKWYEHYEKTLPASDKRVVTASSIFNAMSQSVFESGQPFTLFKDKANATSNQQELGTINCSNLCTEIIQYSSPEETACCNLASIALQRFVRPDKSFDFERLGQTVRLVVRALDRVIDRTAYPVIEAKNSNLRHRPLGLGVQGLADTFIMMRLPFDSPRAQELNKEIAAALYWHAVWASVELAKEYGPHESFPKSPMSRGLLQFDLWKKEPLPGYNWQELREAVMTHGVRNMLLRADMPTASTASFMGGVESTEVLPANIYLRESLSGDHIVVNKHLVEDLSARGLWNRAMYRAIRTENGSIQNIAAIPHDIKELYKTRWEISPSVTIDYSADRGPYICQSQSNNIYVKSPSYATYAGIVKRTWERGLITGVYYFSTKSKRETTSMSIENEIQTAKRTKTEEVEALDEDKGCVMCSS